MNRGAAAVVALLAVLVGQGALSGCAPTETLAERELDTPSASPTYEGPDPAEVADAPYVALGDSYAAAPGVPESDTAGGCFRSSNNYAQLLAEAGGVEVNDVTCSGATTAALIRNQVPSITSATKLVTVGVGGNDYDLFTLLVRQCSSAAASDPDGAPCTASLGSMIQETLPKVDANLTSLFDAIDAALPRGARVVVVGYPRLLPETGSCPDRVTLSTGDYPLFNQVAAGLSDLLRVQAESRDYQYVDLQGPSEGHDICSDVPWVNGQVAADDGTIPFHPFGIEQQAVADLIAAVL